MCDVLLKDPLNRLWLVGVTTNGLLTTTSTGIVFALQNPVILDSASTQWQLSASLNGLIVSTNIGPGGLGVQSQRLVDPNNIPWLLQVNTIGEVTTTLLGGQTGPIPTPPNVSMSHFPDSLGIICPTCGNAIVSVEADFSCWCCACNMFVLPENTTMLIVLEE